VTRLQLVVVLISATLVGVKGVDDWLDDTLELFLHFFNVFGFSGLDKQVSKKKTRMSDLTSPFSSSHSMVFSTAVLISSLSSSESLDPRPFSGSSFPTWFLSP
jgi:hypothetical protein